MNNVLKCGDNHDIIKISLYNNYYFYWKYYYNRFNSVVNIAVYLLYQKYHILKSPTIMVTKDNNDKEQINR